ncbi:MAG: hypothetical protein IPF99_06025 [Deltaproteobacteria bacterium]|nr:hypothetical protein [Deltaproteobacteria bacterium]
MRTIPTLTPFVQQVLDRCEARAPIAFAHVEAGDCLIGDRNFCAGTERAP